MPAKKGSVTQIKTAVISRTDTTAKTLFDLPPNACITDVKMIGTASNAATTATISLGVPGSDTAILNAHDVKTTGGVTRVAGTTAQAGYFFNIVGPAFTVTGKYAETGTASTAGGPWTIAVEYI